MKKPMKMKKAPMKNKKPGAKAGTKVGKDVKRVKGKIVEVKDVKAKKITAKAFGKMKKAPMKKSKGLESLAAANDMKLVPKMKKAAMTMKKAAMKLKKESAMMLKKSMATMKKVSAMKKKDDVQKRNADAMRATLQPGFKGSPKATENTKKFLKRHGLKSVPSRVDITGKRHVAEFLAKKKKK